MKHSFQRFFMIIMALLLGHAAQAQPPMLSLSTEEQRWIEAHPEITLGFTPEIEPLIITAEDGTHTGILTDVYREIERLSGLRIQFVVDDWGKITQLAQRRKIDGLLAATEGLARSIGLLHTEPFVSGIPVIFTRSDAPFAIHSHTDLFGKRVALLKNIHVTQHVIAPYREHIELVEAESAEEMFQLLLDNKVDASYGLSYHHYYLTRKGLLGIRAAYFNDALRADGVAAVRADWPELVTILEKGFQAIGDSRIKQMANQWTRFEPDRPEQIQLSEAEAAWLEAHPEISLGIDQGWTPYVIADSGGTLNGIEPDLLDRINTLSGANIQLVPGEWSELVELAQQEKLDGLAVSTADPQRSKHFLFTQSPYSTSKYIFSRRSELSSLPDLSGLRVGRRKGNRLEERLLNTVPGIIHVMAENDDQLIDWLEENHVDAVIGGISFSIHAQHRGMNPQKMAFIVPNSKTEIVYSIRKDWPELQSIINKALDAIPMTERLAIFNRWSSLMSSRPLPRIELNDEEQAWLDAHPFIRLSGGSFQPFDGRNAHGEVMGIARAYCDLLALKLGIRFEHDSGNWADVHQQARQHNIDGIRLLVANSERDRYLNFTIPYTSTSFGLAQRSSAKTILNLAQLKRRKLAVLEASFDQHLIRLNHPMIKLMSVPNYETGIDAVYNGTVDALVGALAPMEHIIRTRNIPNLRTTSLIHDLPAQPLCMGIREDWPELIPILNRALASISRKEHQEIAESWSSERLLFEQELNLTAAEAHWLRTHRTITYCVDPQWMPFEQINKQGRHEGMVADYMALLARRLGVEFKLEPSDSLDESIQKVRHGESFLLSSWGKTAGAIDPGLPTQSYLNLSFVLATQKEHPFIRQLQQIKNKRIGAVRNHPTVELIRNALPDASLFPVDNIDDGLLKLAGGEIDVFADTLAAISYSIQKQKLDNLKFGGILPGKGPVHMVVSKQEPLLASILNKALVAISPAEHQRISDRWVSLSYEHGFDYAILWRIVGIGGGIILLLAFWNHSLHRQSRKRREAEERLRNIINHMPIAACLVNTKGEIHFRNIRFVELLGYTGKQVPTLQEWWPLAYPDKEYRQWVIDSWSESVRNAAENGTDIAAGEFNVVTAGGETLELEISGIVLENEYLALLIDNTARNRAQQELKLAKEAAEAASRTKSMFLANMSHELRTPLNAILGFSGMLARSPHANAEQRDKLAIINRSGAHLLDMINDVLDLSKIEAGRIEFKPLAFNLRQMLDDLALMFEQRAERAHLQFIQELDTQLACFIETDPGKLRQVLINLLGNAMKFTHQGSVTLRIASRPHPEQAGLLNLHVEVEDTGDGIPEDQIGQIFSPFKQASRSVHPAFKGTGLGLSITKSFIELQGGSLGVESTESKGSRFWFNLPVKQADSAAVNLPVEQSRHTIIGLAPNQPDWRILIVEDDPENRALLFGILSEAGFHPRQAENGAEAVDSFKLWHPHFIWMDIRMPVLNGFDATAAIRALPGGKEPIIVALTASVFHEQEEHILRVGCNAIMSKPYYAHDLFSTMEKWLGVKYLYADQTPSSHHPPVADLSREAIQALPPQLINALVEAAHNLDIAATSQAIDHIRTGHPELATALQQLAGNFEFGKILELAPEQARTHLRTEKEGP